MIHLLAVWLVSALALWLVAQFVPGIRVANFVSAMIAAIIIALVNAILGPVFKFLAFPITFLTLGLFSLVINGFLLMIAAAFTPGFEVRGFFAAICGSLLLTIVSSVLRAVIR